MPTGLAMVRNGISLLWVLYIALAGSVYHFIIVMETSLS
jgi:hypothetical protein